MAIPALTNVTIALVTSTVRGLRTEVPVGPAEGLDHDCVVNCDNLLTIPKTALAGHRGRLSAERIERLNASLRTALELD